MGNAIGISLIIVLLYIPLLVLTVYCIVLFIKLANRGIKALDIYLSNNSINNDIGNNSNNF
jgi:hypothetical protein